jgi:hypothetical protein
MDKGSTPYSSNVNSAPSKVPLGAVASATAIISTTYNHARATKYIAKTRNYAE